jgi:hypothetical protein
MEVVIIVILILGLGYFLYKRKGSGSLLGGSSTPIEKVISNWAGLIPFYTMSADDFYKQVEDNIAKHEMPDVTTQRVNQKEAGLLSASREYFRIRRGNLIYEVCAAPFGKDFFVSWWLYATEGTARQLFKYTKVGSFLQSRSGNHTFYQADIESMFRTCTQQCITEAVDAITKETGSRVTELEQ